MRILGIIPARLGSTRLPNKPLQLLAGEPLVTRVIERVQEHRLVDRLVVATESPMVARVVEPSGVPVVMTHDGHSTGTERVAEAVGRPECEADGYDIIVNIQGDEPFIPREAVEGAIAMVRRGNDVGTAAAPLEATLADDPGRVKVVVDVNGRALYFSRAVIPFRRDSSAPATDLYWQHLGIYAYSKATLARWVALPPAPAEKAEQLEQLRALHHGMSLGVARLGEAALPGVDTLEDLRRAEAHWLAHAR